jgi:hypothetical protein
MQIKRISLNDFELLRLQQFIIDTIEKNDNYEFYSKGDKFEIDLSEFINTDNAGISIEIEAKLISDGGYEKETGIWQITSQFVDKLRITFFYDGMEIEVDPFDIEEKIKDYFRI